MSLSSAAISYREPAVKIQFKTDASLPAATSDNNGQDSSIEERDSSIADQGASSSIAKKSTSKRRRCWKAIIRQGFIVHSQKEHNSKEKQRQNALHLRGQQQEERLANQ